jgi:hypothetical protein
LAADKSFPKARAEGKKVNSEENVAKVKRPWDEDPSLAPKKRIFLSIDIIDSTRLKTSGTEQSHTLSVWAEAFAVFLSEVVVVYETKFGDVIKKNCPKSCSKLCRQKNKVNVWKYIGDEAVLMAELTCNKYHPSLHVLALAETVKHFNSISEEGNSNKIRCKGTAWVAGFPVKNIELDLPGSGGQVVKDFLGPSMDLGFRLSKVASDDRLIISASLAYLIINNSAMDKSIILSGNRRYHLPLCFGGLAEFKGIETNKHPLIWYSVNDTLESELCHVELDELRAFLENSSFIKTNDPPFILGTDDVKPKYLEHYKKAVKDQKRIYGSPFYPKGKRRSSSKKASGKTASKLNKIVKRIPPEETQ